MRIAAAGLNFPTSVALSAEGRVFVAESGLPFGGAPPGGRVLEIRDDGPAVLLDGLRPPVNGLTFHDGALIVSEGGRPGRISRYDLASGELRVLLDGLPSFGNYHTNMVAVGPDGRLYFSQGALTNSGVIGLDSHDLAWLQHVPHNCDIPGYTIELSDVACETPDPRAPHGGRVATGAFAPFGTVLPAGEVLEGRVPCTASVMSCAADGSDLQLVAWGLRNAFGLGFLPDGRLLATDQGADVRGSRPLANCPDALHEVRKGAWYGWPDFVCGRPATSDEFAAEGSPPIRFVLAGHERLPPPERPLFEFPINAAAVKFDVVPPAAPAFAGDLVVALFGDEKPMTAPAGPRVGRRLARLSGEAWTMHPTAEVPLHRPIDVRFAADGAMFVLDFGQFEMTGGQSMTATRGSGGLYRFPPEFLQEAS